MSDIKGISVHMHCTACGSRGVLDGVLCHCTTDRIERLERELAAVTEMRQHGCDCSDEDACRYARERDAARAENEALRKEAARMRGALEMLYPGLVLDLRYADADDDRDALQSRIDTVEEALSPSTIDAAIAKEQKP